MSVKEEIKVSCYEGYRAEEKPRCFLWRNQPFVIKEISQINMVENLSRDQQFVYDIKTSTGEQFAISYDPAKQKWYILC